MDALIFVGIGVVNVTVGYKFLRDKEYAENYVKTSPKARIWTALIGEGRTLKMFRVMAPVGLVLGLLFCAGGVLMLFE